MPSCPWCGSEEWTAQEVSGTGVVYSWVVVHQALTPSFADEVPYVIATVALDVGCRMFGRLELPDGSVPTAVSLDQRVAPRFVAHDGWTELRFVLAEVT